MKCINCGTEMKDKSYSYYGIGDWDMDYPASYHEEYRCPNCKCKYTREDHYGDGKWDIPKTVEKPTEKQVKTILFIMSKLHISLEAITKQQCIRDIGKYFDKAKEVANQPRYDDYDDYDDEHYCHCDPYWGNI
jgi:hypothetical protein